MKFALLHERHDPARGGLERYVAQWAAWLANAGYDVRLIVATETNAVPPVGVSLQRVVPAAPTALALAEVMHAAALTADADVIHDFGCGLGGDLLQPLWGTRRAGATGDLDSLSPLRRWHRRLSPARRRRQVELLDLETRQVASPTNLIVACSARVAEAFRADYALPAERLAVVYNGVDCGAFAPPTSQQRTARRIELGLPCYGTLFLQVAHNFALKGVATGIRALANLVRNGHDAHLAVAGRGPDPAPYRRLARRLGVAHRVLFCGDQADIGRFHQAADALVHPTFHDACSLATLEALASGLPVLVSSRDGVAGLIDDAVQGWVIADSGNPDEWVAAMERLLDPARREAMGRQARATAERNDLGDAFVELERLALQAARRRSGRAA